jgi:hypothetical protein
MRHVFHDEMSRVRGKKKENKMIQHDFFSIAGLICQSEISAAAVWSGFSRQSAGGAFLLSINSVAILEFGVS